MSVIARAERDKQTTRRGHELQRACIVMSHHDSVTTLRPHTKLYDQEARDALGVAFARAREAAGYLSRPAFSKACNVGITSLWKLESGRPVSASVYEAAARALPGWTPDTPRVILEGGAAPDPVDPTDQLEAPPLAGPAALYAALEEVGWSPEEEEEFQMYKHMLGLGRLKLTLKRFIEMRNDFEEEEKRRRPTPDDGK